MHDQHLTKWISTPTVYILTILSLPYLLPLLTGLPASRYAHRFYTIQP